MLSIFNSMAIDLQRIALTYEKSHFLFVVMSDESLNILGLLAVILDHEILEKLNFSSSRKAKRKITKILQSFGFLSRI